MGSSHLVENKAPGSFVFVRMILRLLSSLMLCFAVVAETQIAKPKPDWRFKTTVGLNLGQTINQNFIGNTNGIAFSPGFQFDEVVRFYNQTHEWRTEFSLSEAWTLSSPQTAFSKSSDSLNLKTSYLYHILDWFGPYASAKLRTSIFPGYDLESSSTNYRITDAATAVETQVPSTGSNGTYQFPLTSAFLPLFLEQDIGVFFQPYQEDELLLEFRVGATVRENIAKGQLILTAVGIVYNDTQVRRLDNVFELGPSAGVHFKGDFFDKKLSFRLSCDTLWSFLQTPIASVASTNAFSFDLGTVLGLNITNWLSLNYQLKAVLNPAILNQTQLMTNLMLAFNWKL